MNDKYKQIPFFCIHLMNETLREESILNLQETLQHPIQSIEAVHGLSFLLTYPHFPRRHPFELIAKERGISAEPGKFVSNAGEIGCLLSHVSILYHANQQNIPYILIFEDDAEVSSNLATVNAFLEKIDTKLFHICQHLRILYLRGNRRAQLPGVQCAQENSCKC